jgi:hypothetical protein
MPVTCSQLFPLPLELVELVLDVLPVDVLEVEEVLPLEVLEVEEVLDVLELEVLLLEILLQKALYFLHIH